jgi:hypothetical protein
VGTGVGDGWLQAAKENARIVITASDSTLLSIGVLLVPYADWLHQQDVPVRPEVPHTVTIALDRRYIREYTLPTFILKGCEGE